MLRSLRERLTLLLLAVLPFHALLVTFGTRMIAGPDQAPLSWLALWKELLIVLLLALVCLEYLGSLLKRPRTPFLKSFDVLDALILLLLLSLFVTLQTGIDLKTSLFGFKYDFFPLVAFFVMRRVPWSEQFLRRLLRILLAVGLLAAAYGIVTFFLPLRAFLWLGYSPVHSLYFADGPLAAFQQIGDTTLRRIQGSFSGPNQLGLWLLLPLGIALTAFLKEKGKAALAVLLFLGIALLLSLSRSAIIGGFVAGLVALYRHVPVSARRRTLLAVLGASFLCAVILILLFPQVFWRLGSSRGHIERPIAALQEMIAHPLGKGLGTAGPAQIHLTDSCVHLRPQDDPSWAKNIPRLCVYVGETQVQPLDRECACPFLPENWYLQIGVELGIAGFLLYLLFTGVLLAALSRSSGVLSDSLLFCFIAIAVASLFLHAWEDSAVAYSIWLLLGMQLRPRVRK